MLEFLRLALVYVHLIACCVALGAILACDARIAFDLFRGRSPSGADDNVQRIATLALAVLWITGITFIVMDARASTWIEPLMNPKLQAKIIVVSLLTLNGAVLHRSILPLFAKHGTLLALPAAPRLRSLWAGAFSCVSWLYAAFLGVARPLSWKYPLSQVLALYPTAIFLAAAGALLLTWWAREFAPIFSDAPRGWTQARLRF